MKVSRSWWLLLIISLGVMIPFMAPYLTFDPARRRVDDSSPAFQFPLLVTHILTAFIALVTGFLQFLPSIRAQKPHVHRMLGRVYVISVFISAVLALILTVYIDNFARATSFLALTLFWLITCWKGYRTAVLRKFEEHRKWMIRCFGITLVAVCARILTPVLLLTYASLHRFQLPGGVDTMVEEVLNVNVWVGLIVSFVIVEWFVLKPSAGKRKTKQNPLK